jgi:hypothetical protein
MPIGGAGAAAAARVEHRYARRIPGFFEFKKLDNRIYLLFRGF